jgi:hypothetical protein
MVTKINPVFVPGQPRAFLGKTISTFNIDFEVDADGSLGPNGAVAKTLQTVAQRATIVMYSDITGTGQLMTVFVEGEFPTDDYNGVAGTETFAAQLQADIRALGTVDSISLAGALVTAGTVYKADQV